MCTVTVSHRQIIFTDIFHSPCGMMLLADYNGKLCMSDWMINPHNPHTMECLQNNLYTVFEERCTPLLECVKKQLCEYFEGIRMTFDIPLFYIGSSFQCSVMRALKNIPYGTTTTYAEIACKIGNPRSVRAVAHAIACNPLSIIIPCHRVVGSNHRLTGYAGGLEAKRFLINLESPLLPCFR